MLTHRPSDEELSAWVDGEGLANERAEIEAWLRAHPDDAASVQAWARDRDALRAAYAAVAREPVPPRLAETVWQRDAGMVPAGAEAGTEGGAGAGASSPRAGPGRAGAPPRPRVAPLSLLPVWGLAAAAAGLFLLGAAAGGLLAWQWQERATLARAGAADVVPVPATAQATQAAQGWLQRAAFAHSVYTPEPRHAVEVKAQEEHLARWLTRRIDAPVKLFDLRALGFDLVGGRLLPDGAGKSAQLMYQDANGKRVTVYLRKPESGTDTAFRYEQQGRLGLFYWIDEKTGFALVGELPKEQLLALAKSIHDQDATLPAPSLTPPSAAAASGPSAAAAAAAAASAPGR